MTEVKHASDCAVHNMPAMPAGPCDCGAQAPVELALWQSRKVVRAGEITEVVEAGCYVRQPDGLSVLLAYPPNMTARYTPVAGDYWLIYPDGYQAISPRPAFVDGYTAVPTTSPYVPPFEGAVWDGKEWRQG